MLKSIAVIFILIASAPILASKEKLVINSDNLLIDQDKNQANFSGDVILYFNDLVLKTTILNVTYKIVNNRRTIEYILIPSKVSARKISNQEIIIANSAKYNAALRQLILTGDVIVQKENNILKTKELIYYSELKNLAL